MNFLFKTAWSLIQQTGCVAIGDKRSPKERFQSGFDWFKRDADFIIVLGSVNCGPLGKAKVKKPKKQNCSGLDGLKIDAANIYKYLRQGEARYVGQLEMGIDCKTKGEFLQKLKNLINQSKENKRKLIIYYSGHGASDGSWAGQTYSITRKDILKLIDLSRTYLIIDACYSGKWRSRQLLAILNSLDIEILFPQYWLKKHVVTSADEDETCQDWGADYGGAFTYSLTHKPSNLGDKGKLGSSALPYSYF